MIKAGDKFYEGDNLWTVEGVNDDVVSVRSENEYVQMPDRYVMELMYQQQKQRADELEDVIKRYHDEALREIKRADELEKRWSELRDFLNESAMLADEKFQKVNNAALLSEAITCERIIEKMHEVEFNA